MFRFLRSIGLRPLEWSQAVKATDKATPFIGEILDIAFSRAQAVVVLLTPDDEARLCEEFRAPDDAPHESQLTGQARPNVLFEAGIAMGRSPDRTVIVELGAVKPFSDIAGRLTIKLSNAIQDRQELAQRLQTAGCPVDLTGKDWYAEGDFDLKPAGPPEPGPDEKARDLATQILMGPSSRYPAQIAVLTCLLRRSRWYKIREILDYTGLDKREIIPALNELRRYGYLDKLINDRGRNGRISYRFNPLIKEHLRTVLRRK